MSKIEDTLEKISKTVGTIDKRTEKTQTALDSHIKTTNKAIESVQENVSTNSKRIDALDESVSDLRNRLRRIGNPEEAAKQRLLRNNIAITGISVIESDLNKVVHTLFSSINADVLDSDIKSVYYTSSTEKSRIIVQLGSLTSKLKVLKASKAAGDITLVDASVEDATPEERVYISNHFTPFFANLLMAVKAAVRSGHFATFWYTLEGFCVRHASNSERLFIRTSDDLKYYIGQKGKSTSSSSSSRPAQNNNNRNRFTRKATSPAGNASKRGKANPGTSREK